MALCRELGAVSIINDNVEIARLTGADGVHVGQEDMAAARGFTPLVLAASTPEMITESVSSPELLPFIYFADRKTLMTLNRSNGGVSFFSDGQIVAKWSVNRLPDDGKLEQLASTDPIESLVSENHASKLKFQAFLLYVCAVILLL